MKAGAGPTGNDVLISIVIASFNAGDQLAACLASIQQLQLPRLEVVVIDGGSRDNTLQVLEHNSQLDISWISEPDQGIYDALNKGVQKAKGKWIHFLGTDDRLLTGFAQLVGLLKEEDTVYYGNSQPFYQDNKRPPYILLGGKFSKYRLAKYCINHQAIIYPASVFSQYSYNGQYRIFADYALNICVWGNRSFRKVYHPIDIVQYNMNGFSSLHTDGLFKQHKAAMIRQHLGWWVYWRFWWKKYRKKLAGQPDW